MKDHESTRRKLWSEVWIATARSDNCTDPKVATNWADSALEEFDKRFSEEENDENTR